MAPKASAVVPLVECAGESRVDLHDEFEEGASRLGRPKTRKPDPPVLAWAQHQSIIDAAESPRDQLVKVACATAVRPGGVGRLLLAKF